MKGGDNMDLETLTQTLNIQVSQLSAIVMNLSNMCNDMNNEVHSQTPSVDIVHSIVASADIQMTGMTAQTVIVQGILDQLAEYNLAS